MEETAEKKLKKRHPIVVFFRGILCVILMCVIAVVALCLFSMIDRKSVLSVLPREYAAYVHTDSVWDAVEPLLDLQAADVLLSSPDFVQYRQPFMAFRSSPLRSHALVRLLASRTVDAAWYQQTARGEHFVAAIDLSFLSFATRALKWYGKLLNQPAVSARVPGLQFVSDDFYFLEYQNGDSVFYVRPCKNLVIVSDAFDLFVRACNGDNDTSYTDAERVLLSKRTEQSVRVVADAARLASAATQGNDVLSNMAGLLSQDVLTVISFDITDEEITLTMDVPLSPDKEHPTSLDGIITRNSSMPAFLTRMSDIVQYYTVLNAGSLEELKEALFPLVSADKNAEGSWKSADTMCKTVFGMSLSELLFSWTGTEFAVLGTEGQNEPVFVVQIADEQKRQHVFDKILSSVLIKDDTSLILGGVRLPRLQVPAFIQKLLSLFSISLPSPYYLVHDGFIYFSESPESLSALFTAAEDGRKLSKNKNWLAVSKNQKTNVAVSLYYDLEHSVPFFLRGNDDIARILRLYTIGRADMRLKDAVVTCQLHAVARRSGDLREIAGFPIALSQHTDGILHGEYEKNPEAVFWVEAAHTVKSLTLSSMQQAEMTLSDACTIVASQSKMKNGGVLWAVSEHGAVYLLTQDLETVDGFPVILEESPVAAGAICAGQLVVPTENGLYYVSETAKTKFVSLPLSGGIKAPPSVAKKVVAVYDKSFAGKILVVSDGTLVDGADMQVAGIAYGSPAVISERDGFRVAFITQAGNLYLWKRDALVGGSPIKLDGVFYTNVVASEDYFYALSDAAVLYRIAKDGSYTSVAIPHATARNAFLTVTDARKNGTYGVYICADSNTIYGFKENLELISGFPVVGWGRPVFADVNADRNVDVLALTMDKQLVAWNLR